MAPALTQDDPLRLTRCMRCGYSLDTLPPRGRCPECGSPYGPETVVLYGASCDDTAAGSRASSAATYGVAGLIIALHLGQWIKTHDAIGLIWTGLWTGQFLLLVCWRWIVSRNAPEGCALQCRFNSRGFVVCDVPDEMAGTMGLGLLIRWSGFAFLIPGVVLFLAPFTSPQRPFLKAAVIAAVMLIGYVLTRLRRATPPPQGPLSRALTHGAASGVTPLMPVDWSVVDRYAIHPIVGRPNRHLIRITGKQRFSRNLVVAELRCTTEQAKELSRRIAMWLRAAREAAWAGLRS